MPCWRPPNSTKTSSRRMAATRPLCSDSGSKAACSPLLPTAQQIVHRIAAHRPIQFVFHARARACRGHSAGARGRRPCRARRPARKSDRRRCSRERPADRGPGETAGLAFAANRRLCRDHRLFTAACRLPTVDGRLAECPLPTSHCECRCPSRLRLPCSAFRRRFVDRLPIAALPGAVGGRVALRADQNLPPRPLRIGSARTSAGAASRVGRRAKYR